MTVIVGGRDYDGGRRDSADNPRSGFLFWRHIGATGQDESDANCYDSGHGLFLVTDNKGRR